MWRRGSCMIDMVVSEFIDLFILIDVGIEKGGANEE